MKARSHVGANVRRSRVISAPCWVAEPHQAVCFSAVYRSPVNPITGEGGVPIALVGGWAARRGTGGGSGTRGMGCYLNCVHRQERLSTREALNVCGRTQTPRRPNNPPAMVRSGAAPRCCNGLSPPVCKASERSLDGSVLEPPLVLPRAPIGCLAAGLCHQQLLRLAF